jgi:ethanolamine utilization cobalamin adenosyltransferase
MSEQHNPLAEQLEARAQTLIDRSNAALVKIQPLFDEFVKVQTFLAMTSLDSAFAGETIARLNTIDASVQGATRAMAQAFIEGIVSSQGIGRPDVQEKLKRMDQIKRGMHHES